MAWKVSVCFGNVDVLFSFLCCILSFHAVICMGIKFSRWCWDLLQTCYTHLLICLSLEGNGACVLLLFLFNLSCFWELLFCYTWRIWLVLEAKIPMSLFAFSWRLSIWVNCGLIEVCVLSDDKLVICFQIFAFSSGLGWWLRCILRLSLHACITMSGSSIQCYILHIFPQQSLAMHFMKWNLPPCIAASIVLFSKPVNSFKK